MQPTASQQTQQASSPNIVQPGQGGATPGGNAPVSSTGGSVMERLRGFFSGRDPMSGFMTEAATTNSGFGGGL